MSGPMPRMSVIGYAIAASPLGAPLNELPKAGDGTNGLVDRFGADLAAGISQNLSQDFVSQDFVSHDTAADALYPPHAQPRRHHAHARAYRFAHAETAGIIAGG